MRSVFCVPPYICLAVAYQKVTVVSVRIQHRIALIARYRSVIPRFARQIRSLRWRRHRAVAAATAAVRTAAAAVHWRRRRQRIVAPIDRVAVAAAIASGVRSGATAAAARRAAAERCRQIFGQLLQIVARHQTDLTRLTACLVPSGVAHDKQGSI